MKKILLIILLVVISTTITYSTSPPVNSHGNPSITVPPINFGCTIIIPASISCPYPIANLGEFVKSQVPYTQDKILADGGTVELDFQITGQPNHKFYYKITPDVVGKASPQVAQLTLGAVLLPTEGPDGNYNTYNGDVVPIPGNTDTKSYAYFDNNGNSLSLSIMVLSVLALNPGSDIFVQTITVSYNSL